MHQIMLPRPKQEEKSLGFVFVVENKSRHSQSHVIIVTGVAIGTIIWYHSTLGGYQATPQHASYAYVVFLGLRAKSRWLCRLGIVEDDDDEDDEEGYTGTFPIEMMVFSIGNR